MTNTKALLLGGIVLFASLFSSCTKDNPILTGATVSVSNTLETATDPSMGGTGGVETPIETILGVPAGSLTATATVSEGIEFKDYLEGLYDIDLSENEITFTLVAASDHPFYSAFFRTIEPGTFDRYYLEFTDTHNIESWSSTDGATSLSILSDNEILVTIGEGFSFNPGSTFTISLN